jgi:hypothetical protein
MKNSKLFGIILVAVIVFLITMCDNGTTGGTTETGTGQRPRPPIVPDNGYRYLEVETEGRLTITGLPQDYENHGIIAGRVDDDAKNLWEKFDICASDKAINISNDYGKIWRPYSLELGGIVTNGQADLKVFLRLPGGYQNYNGNGNIKLTVYVLVLINMSIGYDFVDKGTVTVTFVNGVGTGVFVPN